MLNRFKFIISLFFIFCFAVGATEILEGRVVGVHDEIPSHY